jgi:hypothetical protein
VGSPAEQVARSFFTSAKQVRQSGGAILHQCFTASVSTAYHFDILQRVSAYHFDIKRIICQSSAYHFDILAAKKPANPYHFDIPCRITGGVAVLHQCFLATALGGVAVLHQCFFSNCLARHSVT